MTAVPAMLDEPVLGVDDGTLLDGAASIWAVITYAEGIPMTPATKAALDQAKAAFCDQIDELGLTVSDLTSYLGNFREGARECRGRSPSA